MTDITFDGYVLFLVFVAALVFLFLFRHLRPLQETEVHQLAAKRRDRNIRHYFTYGRGTIGFNADFKKTMDAAGKFYRINDSLWNFPSRAAALLKYKKHEWIIFAFEKDQRIELLWVNKGSDNTQVTPRILPEKLLQAAQQENYKSVLIFHNHPNPDPSKWDALRPSQQDGLSANWWGDFLNPQGINIVDFVCERGRYLEYSLCASDAFLPIGEFVATIRLVNGRSRARNLFLHLERIF